MARFLVEIEGPEDEEDREEIILKWEDIKAFGVIFKDGDEEKQYTSINPTPMFVYNPKSKHIKMAVYLENAITNESVFKLNNSEENW